MSSIQHFLNDRLTEMMSRIRTLKSDIDSLRNSFWSCYSSMNNKGQVPPFIYPTIAFRDLHRKAESLEAELNQLDLSSMKPLSFAICADRLCPEFDETLTDLAALQLILHQRTCGLGVTRTPEYNFSLDLESGWISKSFNAVDALSFEITHRMLGKSWVAKNRFVPISVYGGLFYTIHRYSWVTAIPYYDSFRSRFWAILGHELGHVATDVYYKNSSEFGDVLNLAVSDLLEILGYRYDNPDGRYYASLQVTELSADIFGAAIIPSTFITASEILPIPYERRKGALNNELKTSSHPLTDVRLATMGQIVKETGIIDCDRSFREWVDSVFLFLRQKNLMLSKESSFVTKRYSEMAEEMASCILEFIKDNRIRITDANSWSGIYSALESKNLDALSPVELANIPWIKRYAVTRDDVRKGTGTYVTRREDEPKTWDVILNYMYKYYEQEIVPNIRGDNYDIWINTS